VAETARKTRSRSAATARDLGARHSRLILLGDPDEVEQVRPAFATLKVDLEWMPGIALPACGGERGVIVVDLASVAKPIATLETLRTLTEAPAYLIVGEGMSDRAIRRCYEAGAAGVFEWPLEALLIGRYIAEMLALRMVHGRAEKSDTSLARTVRTHLKLLPGLTELPTIRARDGVVSPQGAVESLRMKREIERCLINVPGVRSVDLSGLNVLPVAVPEDRIRRSARRLLEASPDLDPSTIALSLQEGQLIIEGRAPSAQAVRLFEERAAGIAGLRGVANRTRVAKNVRRADRGAARRIRSNLETAYPGRDVQVSYFDATALLSGTVESLRTRQEIREMVSEDPAVERVIDKIDVSPRAE
jgi:osmotically-inducible protein OsmY